MIKKRKKGGKDETKMGERKKDKEEEAKEEKTKNGKGVILTGWKRGAAWVAPRESHVLGRGTGRPPARPASRPVTVPAPIFGHRNAAFATVALTGLGRTAFGACNTVFFSFFIIC